MNKNHYHITIGIEIGELRSLQQYFKNEFKDMTVDIKPDSTVDDSIHNLLLHLFAVIRSVDLNKVN